MALSRKTEKSLIPKTTMWKQWYTQVKVKLFAHCMLMNLLKLMMSWNFFFSKYIFIYLEGRIPGRETQAQREWERENELRSSGLDGNNNHGWARPNQGPRNPSLSLTWVARAWIQVLDSSSASFLSAIAWVWIRNRAVETWIQHADMECSKLNPLHMNTGPGEIISN